jgi:hypothetical protein
MWLSPEEDFEARSGIFWPSAAVVDSTFKLSVPAWPKCPARFTSATDALTSGERRADLGNRDPWCLPWWHQPPDPRNHEGPNPRHRVDGEEFGPSSWGETRTPDPGIMSAVL